MPTIYSQNYWRYVGHEGEGVYYWLVEREVLAVQAIRSSCTGTQLGPVPYPLVREFHDKAAELWYTNKIQGQRTLLRKVSGERLPYQRLRGSCRAESRVQQGWCP